MPVCDAKRRDSLNAVGIADGKGVCCVCVSVCVCVCCCVWTMSNSLSKIILGISGLNISQILRMAAPSFHIPLVSVFPGLFFFLFCCQCGNYATKLGGNQRWRTQLQFSKISSWWVLDVAKHFKNGLLASFYHLPFYNPEMLKIPQ